MLPEKSKDWICQYYRDSFPLFYLVGSYHHGSGFQPFSWVRHNPKPLTNLSSRRISFNTHCNNPPSPLVSWHPAGSVGWRKGRDTVWAKGKGMGSGFGGVIFEKQERGWRGGMGIWDKGRKYSVLDQRSIPNGLFFNFPWIFFFFFVKCGLIKPDPAFFFLFIYPDACVQTRKKCVLSRAFSTGFFLKKVRGRWV